MAMDIVVVAAARTGIGKFGGTLAKTPAAELGAASAARRARPYPHGRLEAGRHDDH